MSWLFKSNNPDSDSSNLHRTVNHPSPPHTAADHGVKDDLSLIFRGVANFLAPPPSSSSSSSAISGESTSPSPTLAGIRNDLVEIGGSFRSSLSLLSPRKAVTGISKLASQLLQSERDQQEVDGGAVPGITDDVVRFVKGISTRPECWTEFPLSLHNDCSLSNSQREHALAIEQLVPEFVTLRMNLCSYMNVEKFWMIYFLLILPRLDQHDFECLSTPKIVEARDVLLRQLEERKDMQEGKRNKSGIRDTNQEAREDSGSESVKFEQNQILTEVTNAAKGLEIDDTVNSEKWLTDTDVETTSFTSCTKHRQEEDISFSDLEEDGSYSSDKLSGHGEAIRGSSPDGSSDWVQLRENERGGRQKATGLKGKDSEDESSDWLAV